jgi:hypothetical protein
MKQMQRKFTNGLDTLRIHGLNYGAQLEPSDAES